MFSICLCVLLGVVMILLSDLFDLFVWLSCDGAASFGIGIAI